MTICNKIEKEYPDLIFQDLVKTEEESGFGRKQIIHFYTLFKTMSKITALKDIKNLNPIIGVDYETFRMGIRELIFENDDMCLRFYELANISKSGILNWAEFLESMKILMT